MWAKLVDGVATRQGVLKYFGFLPPVVVPPLLRIHINWSIICAVLSRCWQRGKINHYKEKQIKNNWSSVIHHFSEWQPVKSLTSHSNVRIFIPILKYIIYVCMCVCMYMHVYIGTYTHISWHMYKLQCTYLTRSSWPECNLLQTIIQHLV